jgi:transcription-repair coupling factor (superfamily II helicase)
MKFISPLCEALRRHDAVTLARAPDGLQPLVVAEAARKLAKASSAPVVITVIARDGGRMAAIETGLAFLAPDIEVLTLPAWDCQPYDRASPNAGIVAHRVTTLARLSQTASSEERPRILLTTLNAMLQRVPPRAKIAAESLAMAAGNAIAMETIANWLESHGYMRAGTVRDTGDYAVRGGILDLYPPGLPTPIRLDFFGETLESIRAFDPETQRSSTTLRSLDLVPMSEARLTTDTIKRFRQGYVAAFGAPSRDDTLYEAVSEGRRHAGLEHWLPLFHEKLDTLFEFVMGSALFLDANIDQALHERLDVIKDYYEARTSALEQKASGGSPYKPLPPHALYMTLEEWNACVARAGSVRFTPFAAGELSLDPTHVMPALDAGIHVLEPQSDQDVDTRVKPAHDGLGSRAQNLILDASTTLGRSFAPERLQEGVNIFDAAIAHIQERQKAGKRVILAAWSEGSRERLLQVLKDHGLPKVQNVGRLNVAMALPRNEVTLAIWGVEQGFETPDLTVMSEQDILGDRLVRPKRKNRRPQDVIAEAASLSLGDLVVHADHGIGRFVALKTVTAAGIPHDCLEIHYAGSDKLFLPVENIELISRYGSEDTEVALDRLGGGAWQARKARAKKRILEMAAGLIKIAAARLMREAPRLNAPDGLYAEFAARFPYDETEDQQGAIDAALEDLASGQPMDRLVCGDVGFGKTEVALRAAFVAAMNGKQVAVVVPTTLLARQHTKSFTERFQGLPLRIAQASRFVPAPEMKLVKEGMANGTVDIVVGTHALFAKGVSFKDLGLMIIDEEQHFGVAHKERLKELRAEIHVLTLSATPIPRTLQLAMTGVRDLSIIATPPVDRLAVRTFVTPFDPLTIREALLRERYRGGQAFYVVPRIDDLSEVKEFLDRHVPEVKVGIAHGQMAAGQLEDIMTAFYEGKFDVLLSTTIVESGLDIPTANTLIVHRADMFGLAQMYQLRGRVGRSKVRAYALFTIPAKRQITPQAEKRLKVLQSLDTLGAGFQLASHDLDIRGAGNLLGDEQSGHIKEVGFELYQQMLEEAVANLKAGIVDEEPSDQWSPTIAVGAPVTIPDTYIEDIHVRMGIYKRLSQLETDQEIDGFGAELIDRFGTLPDAVTQLLRIVQIKVLCRRANVDKVEAGPKGLILSFRDNAFANPEALMKYLSEQGSFAKVRPDMKIVFVREFDKTEERIKGTTTILRQLVGLAEKKKAA